MRRVTLEALGLSPKEHTVLGVLQQQSLAQKISTISTEAELPHATTSFILRKLEKRKLVTRIRVENHFRWKYRKTLDMLESKSPEVSSAAFLDVAKGMTNIVKEFMKLLELASTERLYSIQGAGISKNILKKMDMKFLAGFHHEVKRRKIIIEGVAAKSVLGLFDKMSVGQLQSHLDRLTVVYILPDELLHFPLDVFIFRDRVLLVDYETERLVRIDDSALAQVFKALFSLAEQYGNKIDLNKHIRELVAKKSASE